MKTRVKWIIALFTSAVLIIFLYILLHEFGHLIVMISAGTRITEFSILRAHVSGDGGNYTNATDLWLHANGAFFPLVVSYIYLLLYRMDCKKLFYRVFSGFWGIIPTASLLAWVIIPFLFMNGNAPADDDVTLFLFNFSQGHNPIIVSLAATVLIGISIVLLIKKRVFHNFFATAKEVRNLSVNE